MDRQTNGEEKSRSRALPVLLFLFLGLVFGIFAHYMLFRLSLPIAPFIYVSF